MTHCSRCHRRLREGTVLGLTGWRTTWHGHRGTCSRHGLAPDGVSRPLDVDLVRADMAEHGDTGTSWDWEADLRFARAVDDVEAIRFLEDLLARELGGIAPLLMDAHDVIVGHITRRRVRAMGALARAGEAEATWDGLGAGGRSTYGVARIRRYDLNHTGRRRAKAMREVGQAPA